MVKCHKKMVGDLKHDLKHRGTLCIYTVQNLWILNLVEVSHQIRM